MIQTLKCPKCGVVSNYELSEVVFDINESYVNCYYCMEIITLLTEGVVIENTNEACSEQVLPVLEEGEIVVIVNKEHVWNGELALICGHKHKHYRIEIFGKKLWVPLDWVKAIDDSS